MIEKFKIAKNSIADRNVRTSVEQIKQQQYVNNIENKTKINEIIDELGTNETSTASEISDIKDRLDTAEGTISSHTTDIGDLQTSVATKTSYSTNETVIGTWINNKPLYRKVFSVGALPNATSLTVNTGLTNFNAVKLYGFCVASNNITLPIPYSASSVGSNIVLTLNASNQLVIDACTTDRSGYNGTIIMEYIKTTD